MVFKKTVVILLLLVSFLEVNAQNFEMGKVTIEELKEKNHPKDSSAIAAILFKKGNTYFELTTEGKWEVITEVETRVKIYKKEGLKYSTQQVDYYTGNSVKENVFFSSMNTYNLVDGKIEKTKLKSEGEFKEQINKNWAIKKIAFPAVKEGSVLEFKYKVKSTYITTINDWSFQEEIPTKHVEYHFLVPQYFTYNTVLLGFIKINQKSETVTTLKGFSENKASYYSSDVPGLKDESYVSNIKNYSSTLKFELSSVSYPNQTIKNYASNWEEITKNIYQEDDFGRELKLNSYFESDLEPLIKKAVTRDEKIAVVFEYVKNRMNWNQKNGYNCDKGVKKAFIEKTGNVAEINLMLVAMLRYAGIDANPVILSTRANGIAPYPSRTAFNYVIAAVEIQDDLILLDATSKNAQPNILPFRALNWIGRIIRKEGSSAEVDLMPKSNSKEVVNLIATIDAQGKISGKIKDQYFDYNAFAFRERNNGISKDSYLENLEKKYTGIEIGEYEALNNTDFSKPVVENYSFTHTNAVEIIGNKMYFSPMVFFTQTNNPFTQETREYPIDFVFPHQDKYVISITIPEGYTIETLPQSKAVGMPDNMGNFKYNISGNGKQCQLLFTVDINQSIMGSEYYEALKNFYKELIEKQNEKIVITKTKL